MIRRVKKICGLGSGMRPRQQQVGIAIAVRVARAAGKFRIAEGYQFRDWRNTAVLDANLFQVGAVILLRTVLCDEFAMFVLYRGTASAISRSGAIQNQFLHRRGMTVSCSTFFKKGARHTSLRVFLV